MLQSIPDTRPTLQSADATELAEICEVFRITVLYDKPDQTIELSATILPELLPKGMTRPTPKVPSGYAYIAGAGSGRKSATVPTPVPEPKVSALAYRIEESWPLGREPVWRRSLARVASRVRRPRPRMRVYPGLRSRMLVPDFHAARGAA
jgi:hypothetical protein